MSSLTKQLICTTIRDWHGVLVAFVTEQPKATRKYFVRAKQTKLPRKYQHYAEIKFTIG